MSDEPSVSRCRARPRPAVDASSAERTTSEGRVTNRYQPLGWVLVRAPLLPVEAYLGLAGGSPTRLLGRPQVQAALAVGSESLSVSLDHGESGEGKRVDRRRDALLRYLIRMSTRPTPYGLFAAVNLAYLAEETTLRLEDRPRPQRTRPDMGWVLGLVASLEQRHEIRSALRLVANTAAQVATSRVELPIAVQPPGCDGVSVRATAVVRRALLQCRAPTPYAQVADELLSMPGATRAKVDALLAVMCAQGLLWTDLRPPLTCPSPALYVLRRLAEIPAAQAETEGLERLLAEMQRWDAACAGSRPGGDPVNGYRCLTRSARNLYPGGFGDPVAQVDAALPLAGAVGRAVAQDAAEAVDLLMRLTPHPDGTQALIDYKNRIAARYGRDADVPLLDVLDLLEPPDTEHSTAQPADAATNDLTRRQTRDRTLLHLATSAIRDGARAIELGDKAMRGLQLWSPDPARLPATVDLCVFVAAANRQALANGDYRIVVGPNVGAPAAGRYLARFADLLGTPATDALATAASAEASARPGCILAELVYLPPHARSANVAVRPAMQRHEIVLATSAGVARQYVVPLDELVVSLRGNRLAVTWPTRGVELACTAGHMLNSLQAPPVLQFLEAVSRGQLAQFARFDWGPAATFPYLPRVQRGRIVLAPARWHIDSTLQVAELSTSPAGLFPTRLRAWRERWRVPRRVYVSLGDNRLLVDLDDAAQACYLRKQLSTMRDRVLVLEEALPGPEDAWLPGPGGHYFSEFVVPVGVRPSPTSAQTAIVDHRTAPRVTMADRLRPPGSDWLFLKLYCRTDDTDRLVGTHIAEFGDYLTGSDLARSWFFVRYADPAPHLRLRLHGSPRLLTERTFAEACTWAAGLVSSGLVTRWTVDTYEREVERYGGAAGTALAEAIAAVDSRAVADVLRFGHQPLDRIDIAVRTVDDLLAALGLTLTDRVAWYRGRASRTRDAGARYRGSRSTLQRLLGGAPGDDGLPPGLSQILAARQAALASLAIRLTELSDRPELTQSSTTLYGSYVHLHCNRLGLTTVTENLVLELTMRAAESLVHEQRGESRTASV